MNQAVLKCSRYQSIIEDQETQKYHWGSKHVQISKFYAGKLIRLIELIVPLPQDCYSCVSKSTSFLSQDGDARTKARALLVNSSFLCCPNPHSN